MPRGCPTARAGRRHRRRRHRHERRLPPDQARLDRRRAARAGPALVGHDLARGRAGRPAARQPERHPAGAVLHRALLPARGRGRAVHRVQALRRRDGRAHRGPDDPAASYGGDGGGLRPRVRAALARGGARALPDPAGRRPGRRDLAARRRQGQPDRPDRGAGARGPAARRPGLRAHPRARRARRGRPGHRRTHRRRRHRGRGRRQLRRASGPRRSARWPASTCRCTPPSTSTSSPTRSRACTPTCRCCATPTATPTSRRRSAAWSSAGSSPTPSRGCRRTRSPTRSSSSCSRRTGTTSRR